MRLLRKHSIGLTSTEFDYLDGVTSGIQTQMDGKAPTTGHSSIATVGTVTSGTISTGTVVDDPTMTQGSDAEGDVYYRASDGKLTRLATGADGTVLTSTGTTPPLAFEAIPAGGITGWAANGSNNDLLPGSASAGIYLGVSSATASNLLDDYEEGNWTASVLGLDSGSITLDDNTGYFQLIGHFCFITAGLSVDSVSSPTGNMNITLPKTPIAADARRSGLAVYGTSFTGSPYGIMGYVNAPTGYMSIREVLSTGGSADLGQHIQAGTTLFISGSYQVA
jgi:hypothetical protein